MYIFSRSYLYSNISKLLLKLLKLCALIAGGFLTLFRHIVQFYWSVIRYCFRRQESKFLFVI